MTKKLIILLLAVVVLQACKNRRTEELTVPGWEMAPGELIISPQAMDEIIHNVSSPIEMASLIKELGVPFSSRYLSRINDEDRYAGSFKMALVLGVLGADLGYLNVYEKTGSAVHYLSAIKRLADGLRISQFFDFNTLKRMATNSASLDSLIFLSVHSFNQMDNHLRQTNRNNLSSLMVAGVWIEGMYHATQVEKETQNEVLAEYIAEQKVILNDLLLILRNYKQDEQFAILISELEKLKDAFAGVRITYEIGEPKSVEENGMLMIVQQEQSVVEISPGTLEKIIDVTEKVRNRLLTI